MKAFKLAVSDRIGSTDFYKKGASSAVVFEEGYKKFKVNTTSIDKFLSEEKVEKIDLSNMDCEGSELLVLRGAEETLQRNKVKIFYEIHRDFLRDLGQSIQDIVEYLQKLVFTV